jgi:hypothetical protein
MQPVAERRWTPRVEPFGLSAEHSHPPTRRVRCAFSSGSCARGGPERGFTGLWRQTRVLPSNAPDATTRCSNWGVASGQSKRYLDTETSEQKRPPIERRSPREGWSCCLLILGTTLGGSPALAKNQPSPSGISPAPSVVHHQRATAIIRLVKDRLALEGRRALRPPPLSCICLEVLSAALVEPASHRQP